MVARYKMLLRPAKKNRERKSGKKHKGNKRGDKGKEKGMYERNSKWIQLWRERNDKRKVGRENEREKKGDEENNEKGQGKEENIRMIKK